MDQLQEAEEEARVPLFARSTEVIRVLLQESDNDQNFEIILALGVDSKSTDQNQTPLLGLAIESKLFHVVKFLMNNGVDGRATDSQGNTILHMLAKCEDRRIIMMVTNIWRLLDKDVASPDLHWMPLNVERHSPIGNTIYESNEPATRALLKELSPTALKNQHVVYMAVKRNFIGGLKALITWQEKNKSSPSILISRPERSTRTPLEVALEQRHSEALESLLATEDVNQNWDQNLNLVPSLASCGKLEMIELMWPRLNDNQKPEYLRKMVRAVELKSVLKFRTDDRRAQYLRVHLMLAIANDMAVEAQLILDYVQQYSPKDAEDMENHYQTILLPSNQNRSCLLSDSNPNTSPLVMSMSKESFPSLREYLINLEGKFLMKIPGTVDESEVRAHHASKTLDPQSLQICLGPGKPQNNTLEHYFKQLMWRGTLSQRIPSLESKDDQNTVLRWHREWAMQVFDLQILHQVTDALGTLPLDQRQNIICEAFGDCASNAETSHGCLQHAVSSQKRLFVNELVHQEHLCHKDDEIKGTKCIRKQLTHENDIMYTSDMFSSFYPKSAWGKLLSFLFLTLVPSLIGVALICLDIWQDMILTEEYDSLRNISSNSVETAHKYDVAFRIGFTSQFLHLIASIPIWIWICCTYWSPTFNLCRSGCATSTLDNLVTFLVILAPIVSAPTIYFTRGISSPATPLGFMMMSNAFSATLIICLSISRMVTIAKIVFGHDQKRSQNNGHLHRIERLLVMATIGESGLEATVQLGLQVWLLSEESFTDRLKQSGFVWGSVQTMAALFTTEENASLFQVWLLSKLFLSCLAIILSVSKNYRHLRNNSVKLQHLAFIYVSLTCQILARVSVIINWCLQFKGFFAWQLCGVGTFLLINIYVAFIIRGMTNRTRSSGIIWDFQNCMALFLSICANSTLLVNIPRLNQDSQAVAEQTFVLQTLYFITSLIINILWTWMSSVCSGSPVQSGTMMEIPVLLFGSLVCHIMYYTVYGHPWKVIVRMNTRNRFQKAWSEFCKCHSNRLQNLRSLF